MELTVYEYNAKVVAVHDGDTVTLDVDLGFGILRRDKFRLYGPDPDGKMGLNAPELNTPAGKVSQKYVLDLLYRNGCLPMAPPPPSTLPQQQWVRVRTIKDRQEKYGRYLVVVYFNHGGEWLNLNQLLVDSGNAALKEY